MVLRETQMILTFSPLRSPAPLKVNRAGDTLVLNGDTLDLSAIPEGATLPRAALNSPWIASDITRLDGVLRLTLRLPHGARAPQATLFPDPITLTTDGPVALPAYEEPTHV